MSRSYSPDPAARKINAEAARIASKSPVMDAVAGKVLAAIKATAEQHRASGDYVESLEVIKTRGRRGVEDRFVRSTDPAAVSIEYGHLTGKKDSPDRGFVDGKYIMTRAARAYRKGL